MSGEVSGCPAVGQDADVATVKSLSRPNNFLSINLEPRVSHYTQTLTNLSQNF